MVAVKPLIIADADIIVLGYQDEIRRSEESRYDHRPSQIRLLKSRR
jgi:hypothetical protein